MRRQNIIFILIYLIFNSFFLSAQIAELDNPEKNPPKKISLFSELEQEGLPSFEIQTDLAALFKDRKYQEYHYSFINIKLPNGDLLDQEVKIKTRGKFRCKKCDYPPIKIKFLKKELKELHYKKWNEYKMVYPCKSGKKFQNYVYKEYIAYKIYNLLTEKSYRVELVDLVIKDSLDNLADIAFQGFVLEDRDELTKRLNCNGKKVEKISPTIFVKEDYALFQLFQYMISNSDWIPPIGHNVDILETESGAFFPIPFDFDFSGFVGSEYAVPNSCFPITSITERYFLGHQKDLTELQPAIDLFIKKKENILGLVKDFEFLPKSERTILMVFLKDFYRTIEKPNKVAKELHHELPKNMQKFY